MCIFAGNIDNVCNTKIFVSLVHPSKLVIKKVNGIDKGLKTPVGKPLQLVIYSNNVQASTLNFDTDVPGIKLPENAMILPFPLIKGENRVKILDMSNYENIFDDLDMIFPTIKNKGFRGMLGNYSIADDMIPVQYIGNYKASIVPNFDNFDKLKYQEFHLSPAIKELLKKYYAKGYGFMVCMLNNNRDNSLSQFHPFAYVHEIRSDGRLFIPTRHYHKKVTSNPFSKYHNVADSGILNRLEKSNPFEESENEVSDYLYGTLMVDDKWMRLTAKRKDLQSYREKNEIDWDHEIYVVNFPRLLKNPLLSKPGARIINGDLNKLINFYTYIEAAKLPKEIVLNKPNSLFKIKIDSHYKYNHDFYL